MGVFYAKEAEGQMSHKVNSPVSDEGLVSGMKRGTQDNRKSLSLPSLPFSSASGV